MLWAILAILSALMWALVNIVDKFVLTKWIKQPFVPLIFFSIVGFVIGTMIYIFQGFSYLSYLNIFLSVLTGGFYVIVMYFYFKALNIEEVSRVVPLFYLFPLFTLLMAGLFLGEVFTPLRYLGIFLVIFGSIVISSKDITNLRLSKAFWFMILSAFFASLSGIITKYLLDFADFWTIFGYGRFGSLLASIPIFYFYLPDLISSVRKHGKKVIGVITINQTVELSATLIHTVALSIGFVTLVSALSSLQTFFVLIIATLVTIFYPKMFKEKINKRILIAKLAAIIMLFFGVILIL